VLSKKEDTSTRFLRISQLFDNGLMIYLSQNYRDEDIESNFPIPEDTSTTTKYGARYTNRGLILTADTSTTKSTRSPSKTSSLSAKYGWKASPITSISLDATQRWLEFGNLDDRQIKMFKTGARFFSRLTNRLRWSGSAYWRDESGGSAGDTQGLDMRTEVSYTYRKVNIVTGVEYGELDRETTSRNNTLWYLRLIRHF
jgi:hypothetical protein